MQHVKTKPTENGNQMTNLQSAKLSSSIYGHGTPTPLHSLENIFCTPRFSVAVLHKSDYWYNKEIKSLAQSKALGREEGYIWVERDTGIMSKSRL